jgi:glutamate-1-semialdehyde 2,1-aminomutase
MTNPQSPATQSASHAQRFAKAQKVLPGGVNSPVRAFGSVGGNPIFMASGSASELIDADEKRYVDFVLSWGPMILGHAHPAIVEAVQQAASRGLSFGAATEAETEYAEALKTLLPFVEKMRLVCSGTEATMSAVRLARGATGRDAIIKFRGCYHGHGDSFLIQAGSGLATFGNPSSPGVTAGAAKDTLLADYNDLAAVEALFQTGTPIAAIIVEPVPGNMGVVAPLPGFLEGLRSLCDQHGALLIFDEVMSGFRVGPQGTVGLYGVTPDLITLGKIIGGGLPLAAYAGRADLMDRMSPVGPIYQAGTLAGNPLAVAAGLATFREMKNPGFFEAMEKLSARWETSFREALSVCSAPVTLQRVGSMMTIFFSDKPVHNFSDAQACDTVAFARFFQNLLAEGIYWPPSQFEAAFLSLAHEPAVIDRCAEAVHRAAKRV